MSDVSDEANVPQPSTAKERAEPDEPRGLTAAGADPGGHKRRTVGAVLLGVLASLLALLSVVAVWVGDEIGETDRYVATVPRSRTTPTCRPASPTA